jgi:hypothetical protein
MKRVAGLGIFVLLAVVSACASDNATPAASIDTPKQTPTVASIFMMPATPTVSTLQPIASATIALPTSNITATPTQASVYEVPIYQDALSAGWTISNSQGMSIDLANTAIVMSGTRAISFTPQVDYGMLYFTLEPNALLTLPYDKVVGISLRINGGDNDIGPSDLSLSLHGSNAYTYWTSNDSSVQLSDQVQFSETRLYDLEITRAVPQNTWVEVIVYPAKLLYDPTYKYLTGFYLKNDKGIRQTLYIDNVTLLLMK